MEDERRELPVDRARNGDGHLSSRRGVLRWMGGGAALLAVAGGVVLRGAAASDDGGGGDSGHGGHGGDDADDAAEDAADAAEEATEEAEDAVEDATEEAEDAADDDVVATGPVPEGAVEVRIVSDDAGGFSPGELTVAVGATVAFVNGHDDPHTATGAGFDTGIMQAGQVATVVLDEPGTYFYACQIHPEMTGSIVVAGGEASPEAAPVGSPEASPEASPRATPVAGAGGGEVAVVIVGFAFDPAELTVAVGTTVTWRNEDPAPHTASAEDGSFGTGQIDPGGSGSVTLDTAGTFPYVCAFHPEMRGTVTVG